MKKQKKSSLQLFIGQFSNDQRQFLILVQDALCLNGHPILLRE